jgi:hypothetical protein
MSSGEPIDQQKRKSPKHPIHSVFDPSSCRDDPHGMAEGLTTWLATQPNWP